MVTKDRQLSLIRNNSAAYSTNNMNLQINKMKINNNNNNMNMPRLFVWACFFLQACASYLLVPVDIAKAFVWHTYVIEIPFTCLQCKIAVCRVSRISNWFYKKMYRCFGPGFCPSKRVPWAKELVDKEADQFLMHRFIDPEADRPWLAQRMALKIPHSA